MPLTIKDIAKLANVTPSTVSKALNNRQGISVSLKRKIEKIARKSGYAPYIKARQSGMYSQNLKYIGIIYAYAGEHLTRDIQLGIDTALSNHSYCQLRYNIDLPYNLNGNERKEILIEKILENKNISGLVSIYYKLPDSTIAELQKNGIPVVLVNNYSSYGKCVLTDNINAAFKATSIMTKLNRKKIGLIMPEETSEIVWQDRLEGYINALSNAKIEYDPYLLVYEHSFTLKESAMATKVLLEREPNIDAILYGSDFQALGGMEALKSLGKKIPDDIAVMGFDNIFFDEISNPTLSSVKQPTYKMGENAALLLLDAINNRNFKHKAVKLKSEIILRQSTHKNIQKNILL